MIHYHGAPISGTTTDAARFFSGRHGLISFARPEQIKIVAEVSQSFVIDNGAFSHWKRTGGIIDVEMYRDFVGEWCRHPAYDWCLMPDSISGNERDNDKLISQWESIAPAGIGVPVWHLHESLDRLKELCESYYIVALGSSGDYKTPNTASWWARITEAMDYICDESGRPPCKLHGLRMLNPKVFTKIPFSSADSTNATVNAGSKKRFGMYMPPNAALRAEVIASRIEANNSSPTWVIGGY